MPRIDLNGMTRRTLLACLAGVGLWGGRATQALSAPTIISGIRAQSGNGAALAEIASYVGEELASQLGERYRSGAKGGLTVVVTVRSILLPERDTYDDFFDDGSRLGSRRHFGNGMNTDQLDGFVEVLNGKTPVTSFPFFASKPSTFRPPAFDAEPDPNRLRLLARAYAYWLIQKLP